LTWLLLREGPGEPAWNMALDEALLGAAESEGLCALRLYAWGPPALSFGRNEPALRRYDRDAIRARGLATVRRPTGGRAVWHDREVTYSVSAPAATFGSLHDSYHAIHDLLAAALRSLGACVMLAADRPAAGVGAGACFASAAGGEVMTATGGKVVGSAQVRTGSAFLQHGSILLAPDQDVVAAVTRGAAERPHAAGVAELVPEGRGTAEAVVDAVLAEAARRWPVRRGDGPPVSVRRRAEALLDHYRDDAWTWRR
jgi:lipoyl(octanoyl) transferase